tara:strand:- start:4012 stop:4188 length:177 start_codon:yes stop_codon:yes gene_type:complete
MKLPPKWRETWQLIAVEKFVVVVVQIAVKYFTVIWMNVMSLFRMRLWRGSSATVIRRF